ncbi:MAG: hypothetical protein GF355_04735 [Candidatus Eisenbacteria bacterium]|nr:hypothetical protein [Candidatus Eisenbacteria bacterium]
MTAEILKQRLFPANGIAAAAQLCLALLLAGALVCAPAMAATTSADPPFDPPQPVAQDLDGQPPRDDVHFLFDSGTPVTSPYGACGGCYAWSSTYYAAPDNYDLTARSFQVPPGSSASAFRLWWAYGQQGPHPNNANRGGTAADFARISLDLYEDTGSGPGALIANLSGAWTTLDAGTHYKEYQLDQPYTFTASDYYVSLRAETPETDYDATLLWLMCAPADPHVDYETYDTAQGTTGGWQPYTALTPCPADQNFGLQIRTSTSAGPEAPAGCISIANDCATVPFTIDRDDAVPMRGFSVTFTLSAGLELCSDGPAILEGSYLEGDPAVYNTQFYTYGTWPTYTVDCSILGSDCGQTEPTGTLFTVAVQAAAGTPDGTETVTVDAVTFRDCDNQPIAGGPGPPADVILDREAPAVGLTATQRLTGNDGDGTTKIDLAWTGADPTDQVHIYRAGFGHYPEYDDLGGAPPPAPGDYPGVDPEWTYVTTVSGVSDYADETTQRDFWSYAVYAEDACGNVSDPAVTDGTLNYLLGDGVADNIVGTGDVSLMGNAYGTQDGDPNYNNIVDVGPTTDYTVDALPTTDDRIDFEDLMMVAINFDPSPAQEGETAADAIAGAAPELQLVCEIDAARGLLVAQLVLSGNPGVVKGIHGVIAYDPAGLEMLEAAPGALIDGNTFFGSHGGEGRLEVDAAALGGLFAGPGEVAAVRFRIIEPGSRPGLAAGDLRDGANRFLGERPATAQSGPSAMSRSNPREPAADIPATLLAVRPNPFCGRTEIALDLARPAGVTLNIYDIHGRLVRTLLDAALPAGRHRVDWDGTNNAGQKLGPGIYLTTLRAGDREASRKLFLY